MRKALALFAGKTICFAIDRSRQLRQSPFGEKIKILFCDSENASIRSEPQKARIVPENLMNGVVRQTVFAHKLGELSLLESNHSAAKCATPNIIRRVRVNS